MRGDDRPTAREALVGTWTLTRREILRFVRRPWNTFVPPLITNVLYFSVFGVILGNRIREIEGFPYVTFIVPGLISLGMISNAFENACFSVFHGRWNGYIHEVLTSPLSYLQIVCAYIASSVVRALIVAALIAGVAFIFTDVPVTSVGHLLVFAVVVSILFAGLGVIGGLTAGDWEHLSVYSQFILRPLVFFGGIFYSLSILPDFWFRVSLLNPLVYLVSGFRYGMLGVYDIDPGISLAVLCGMTVVVGVIDVWLVRIGYGLRE